MAQIRADAPHFPFFHRTPQANDQLGAQISRKPLRHPFYIRKPLGAHLFHPGTHGLPINVQHAKTNDWLETVDSGSPLLEVGQEVPQLVVCSLWRHTLEGHLKGLVAWPGVSVTETRAASRRILTRVLHSPIKAAVNRTLQSL